MIKTEIRGRIATIELAGARQEKCAQRPDVCRDDRYARTGVRFRCPRRIVIHGTRTASPAARPARTFSKVRPALLRRCALSRRCRRSASPWSPRSAGRRGIGTTLLCTAIWCTRRRAAGFQLPFVPLGLVPEAASSLLLPRVAGYRARRAWLLLGRRSPRPKPWPPASSPRSSGGKPCLERSARRGGGARALPARVRGLTKQ